MVVRHLFGIVCLILLGAGFAAAQKVVGCGCRCGVVLPPPCSDQACMTACGISNPAPPPGPSPEEMARAERLRKASNAFKDGLLEMERSNWQTAIDKFNEALVHDPDNVEYKANLQRAKEALRRAQEAAASAGSRDRLKAAREQSASTDAAARLRMQRESLAQESAVAKLADFNKTLEPGSVEPTKFGFSRTPVTPGSATAIALENNQARIAAVDRKIKDAQDALRRLMKLNTFSESERLEWVKQSESASIEAQDLAVNLVLDLVGARVGQWANINQHERREILDALTSRGTGSRDLALKRLFPQTTYRDRGLHTAFGALLNQKDYLEHLNDLVRLGSKSNDLRVKIRDYGKDKRPIAEDVWDVMVRFEKVEELAGPAKDLVDSALVIIKQGVSIHMMAVTKRNQQNIYAASKKLSAHIEKLVAEKKQLASQS
jgi:tetratricopeptide (TPR) repeat protein